MPRFFGWMLAVVLCCAAGARAGEETPDARLREAQTAFDEATALQASGAYAEALARAEHALALRETVLGGSHPDVASCLDLMGELRMRQRELAQAEPLLRRALAIREAALGKNHPDVAQTLHKLGNVYLFQALYGQAEPLYQRALAIREVALGKNHPDIAKTLNNLAIISLNQGAYDRAEPLHQRALAIREAALGKKHSDVAQSLNNLANLYKDQGLYGRAEPLYQRSLAIDEANFGKHHPALANALNNLAHLYTEQGLYGRAEPLHQRALAIREAALGKDHPEIAQSLINLALLYSEQGLYGRAEPLLQRAIAILEAAFGDTHPDLATALTTLANLHADQGSYGRAEPLYQRALAIQEAALGSQHPEVAKSLNNLAIIYEDQGLYARAEPLYQRSLSLLDAALGGTHPLVATALNNLAILYVNQGAYDRAEPLHQRALAIREAALGGHHREFAQSLNNLATVYENQGLYERAEPLYQRALAIQESALGKQHPDVARTLNGLALLRLGQHRLANALPLFTRAFAISERRLRREALDFSGSRLASFLQYLRADEQTLYALLRAHPEDARVRRLALSAVLLLKGRSVEETANISRSLFRNLDAGDRGRFEQLRGLRTQLATLSLDGPGSLPPQDYQKRLQALVDEGDSLEAALARRSAPLRALTALPPPAEIAGRVASSLPREGALVELIAYQDRPLRPQPGTPREKLPGPLRYLALVLFPDASTRAVDLGPAEPIDRAASRLRNALANREASFQATAQELHRLAFQPLLPVLGKSRRLFLSPDGQLGLVPFAALHDGERFLVDTFDFNYLTSGRELLPRPQEPGSASSIFVLADPDFAGSPRADSLASGGTSQRAERSASLERFFSTQRTVLPSNAWMPLPGTRQEAESIQRLLPQSRLFLGAEATKERLLSLPTPGILHLATHGFFLGDSSGPTTDVRAVGHFGGLADNPQAPGPEEPLLRSGLAFAGASAPEPDASSPSEFRPDASLVTALELAGLDLWGTQLVVLSACDTGRGEVQLGQGISGLRRALVVAGAEMVVMSLWKVNDDSTGVLMETYYRNLLAGQGRASALREAMRSLREARPHPHYWAPFIALGSDAPLRAIAPLAPRAGDGG
ncbi:MAG TPA: tetratricopeptide repeat protein [Archangium sp.]|uniref:CHAT domain-containing tetratricopeptide repeat protein n=1 Tax=Archangium sp. TaxID=1872627 RepID=UPI002E2EF23E|nr:tetratricopeptide repeat protein [Archangium sp.]HEX5746615.1 tetratricopeptide repeat protein [Archangium sp.]